MLAVSILLTMPRCHDPCPPRPIRARLSFIGCVDGVVVAASAGTEAAAMLAAALETRNLRRVICDAMTGGCTPMWLGRLARAFLKRECSGGTPKPLFWKSYLRSFALIRGS